MSRNTGNAASHRLQRPELLFVLGCGVFFFIWSIAKHFNFGPDEMMRYAIPEYIYKHGALPNGNMEELRNGMWGFSYAYYPNFLGPLVSALFMKITSIFTANNFALVVAARFTSVLSGTFTMYFLMKIAKRLFTAPVKWMTVFLLVMIPQFTFLTSYVNNDIICICGSAMMCYAWICGLQEGWDRKNGLLLAVGIIVAALSYYNSYGWILCSLILFVASYIMKIGQNQDYKQMWKIGIFIAVIVLVCVAGFFIRNALLYDGDFLGMRSLNESSELYAPDSFKPSNRYISKNLGLSLWDMLTSHIWGERNWLNFTFISFIGVFSYMLYYLPSWIYWLFLVVLVAGAVGLGGETLSNLISRREGVLQERKASVLFKVCLLISFLTPIALSMYYSYAVDHQAQGRYCYPMVIALAVFWGMGMEWFLKKVPHDRVRKGIAVAFCLGLTAIMVYVFVGIYLPAA